jgi:long-chain acyl-CoA synthetase
MRYMITGTAPCPLPVLEFFDALGVPLLEAYGLSENVVPIAMNRLTDYRLGSVGRPLTANQVELSAEGEVLVRGPGVFDGYLGSGDRCADLSRDGFYASGDLGFFDPDGYLHITGRRKEVVKTASGRQISLTQVEAVLQRIPLVDQAVVCGDGRGPLVALLHLDEVRLVTALAEAGVASADRSSIPAVISGEVAAEASNLASHERVRGLLLLREPLSVAEGELTPSFKVRRAVIDERYGGRIRALQNRIEAEERARPLLVEWL